MYFWLTASLKKLTINVVPSLVFSETQYTTYIGPLPSNTKDMTLTVASKDDTSFVEVQGVRLGNSGTAKIPLSAGANTTVIIKVTSEDGSTQNYFVIAKVEGM